MKSGEYVVIWSDRETTRSVGVVDATQQWRRKGSDAEMKPPAYVLKPHTPARMGASNG